MRAASKTSLLLQLGKWEKMVVTDVSLASLYPAQRRNEMHTITDEFVQNLCHALHLPLGQVAVGVNAEVEN